MSFLYRVRYRQKDTEAYTTFINTGDEVTDADGIIESNFLGGSATIIGLTTGVTYQFLVERVTKNGDVIATSTSSDTIDATPVVATDEKLTGTGTTAGGTSDGATLNLGTRNGSRGAYVLFANAGWVSVDFYFAPRGVTSPNWGDIPSLSIIKKGFVISKSDDTVNSVIQLSNREVFVGFDYLAYQARIVAVGNANKTVDAVLRLPVQS